MTVYTTDQLVALSAFNAARDAEQKYAESETPTLAGNIALELAVSAARKECLRLGLTDSQIYGWLDGKLDEGRPYNV